MYLNMFIALCDAIVIYLGKYVIHYYVDKFDRIIYYGDGYSTHYTYVALVINVIYTKV